MPTSIKVKTILEKKKVKNRIRILLLQKAEADKITYEEVSDELISVINITRNQLTYWEKNNSQPNEQEKIEVMQFFMKTYEEIFYIS